MAIKVIAAPGANAAATGSLWAAQISGNTLGTTALVNSGTLSLNAGTNITLSQSATNKITILGPTNIVSAAVIGGNTSGTTASVSSGTLNLYGGNNVTLSQNANSITISGDPTYTFSQWWAPAWQGGSNLRQFGQSSLQMHPVIVENNVTATAAMLALSITMSTSSNSSYAGTLTYLLGLYSNNASTLGLMQSGGQTYFWTNNSNNSTASFAGARFFTVPLNVNMTKGIYYLGHLSMTATANADWLTASNYLMGINLAIGSLGGGATGTTMLMPGMGHWSVQTAGIPAAVNINALRVNNNPDGQIAMVTFLNATA